MHKYTNQLINQTSPYLLQHAHNPVNWMPWDNETLALAKQQNKMLLISVGYSACHWCHVMEHESFEDEQVAQVMNDNFICIKVDREERPDIDQVYMSAVQLMTGQGGWPLNCLALPDGRPIYGGTYFNKSQWINVLQNVANLFKADYPKVENYAKELTNGILTAELGQLSNTLEEEFDREIITKSINAWKGRFDDEFGGPNRAPKFPLPNNYSFLLKYNFFKEDEVLEKHIHLTLQKMAFGGIYDQLAGGFARYSVDDKWKVPHFEKMLYDNAQLISLYSEAYQQSKNPLYKNVVSETIDFVKESLFSSKDNCFYSALDADSEGVEGKYYIWTKEELEDLLGDDFKIFATYYSVNDVGYWEHGNYILLRDKSDTEVCLAHNITKEELDKCIETCKCKLLKVRNKRIPPGLDDKTLTSWNALMANALIDAYKVFGNSSYLELAKNNIEFILSKQVQTNGSLWHSYKAGKSSINGFLEDYAFFIQALINLFEVSGDEKYLHSASNLTQKAIDNFYDTVNSIFYFTSVDDDALIVRKVEISDNVIPASSSQMARNLNRLGKIIGNMNYIEMSKKMLNHVSDEIAHYGAGYSNWMTLALEFYWPNYEVALVGNSVDELFRELQTYYIPNAIFVLGKNASQVSLLKDRFVEGKNMIYVCKNNSCNLPVTNVADAIKQMN